MRSRERVDAGVQCECMIGHTAILTHGCTTVDDGVQTDIQIQSDGVQTDPHVHVSVQSDNLIQGAALQPGIDIQDTQPMDVSHDVAVEPVSNVHDIDGMTGCNVMEMQCDDNSAAQPDDDMHHQCTVSAAIHCWISLLRSCFVSRTIMNMCCRQILGVMIMSMLRAYQSYWRHHSLQARFSITHRVPMRRPPGCLMTS
jgi:hypothetical protein